MFSANAVLVGTFSFMVATSVTAHGADANARAREFIVSQETLIRPLEKAASLAWWNANISGRDEDFNAEEDAQNRLDAALSDRSRFAS